MKKLSIYLFVLLQSVLGFGQKANAPVQGVISNYANEPVYVYKAYGDTLLLVDTLRTDGKGRFGYAQRPGLVGTAQGTGLYKVNLKSNQSFFVLYDGKPVQIKTIYNARSHGNTATDSLVVIQSVDNKLFYEFQQLQQSVLISDYFLKQMMRLYPLSDPFHASIEKEYTKRYAKMDSFIKKQATNKNSMAMKIAKAYYEPVIADWKQPDYWRDSVKASHYFDYFNAADSFYMHSNVLSEKMNEYLKIRTNKVDAYGQGVKDETLMGIAAQEFVAHTTSNSINYEFCINYFLKKFKKEHLDVAFLYLYDVFAKPQAGDCEQSNTALSKWHDRVNTLRNVQIGSVAPDFELEKDKLWLSGIQSNYTLLVFWASWCPHCTEVLPEVKTIITEFNKAHGGSLNTIAVSLDTEAEAWQKYVQEQKLFQFLNFSELKGWKSDVAKKYNVYATPTMILLDKDKKIIAKPETENQLKELLSTIN